MNQRYAVCIVPGTGGVGVLDRRYRTVAWMHAPECCGYTQEESWRIYGERANDVALRLEDGVDSRSDYGWARWRG